MQEKIRLKKELGLTEAVLCGIGIILGAGIYVLIGETAGLAGNALWLSFLFATTVAAFTGLSYAELSSMYPKAGAEFEYTKHAFGRMPGFVVGWMTIIAGIVSASAVALGFGGYLFNLSPLIGLPQIPVVLAAILLIILCSLIVFIGIKQSAIIAIVFTLIEAFGLILIIFIGLPFIGSVDLMEMPLGLTGVLSGAALIFFAFLGFEEMVRMSEETKNAEKTIPKALMLAIIITAIIYILVGITVVSVIPWQELAVSSAPLALVAEKILGSSGGLLLSVIALFSTSNTVLLILLATSRIVFGIGEDKEFPNIVARIHPKTQTPYIAIILVMVIAIAFALVQDISFIANATDFLLFAIFIAINLAVVYLRVKEPETKRAFRIPLNIKNIPVLPFLGVISCVALITHIEFTVILLATGMVFLGIIFFDATHRMFKRSAKA
ncbi:APC family permease [Candidatus Micrarchaeota archaeon]|nr:APC family permease [Candidatus Micrarchaeota archaeon]MBU2476518.1 APC family permease [Candidatus Micrarchaeota archaeon]